MVDVKTDVRANTPARPSGNMYSDREVLRLPNSSAAPVEERTLSIDVDGWYHMQQLSSSRWSTMPGNIMKVIRRRLPYKLTAECWSAEREREREFPGSLLRVAGDFRHGIAIFGRNFDFFQRCSGSFLLTSKMCSELDSGIGGVG